MELASFSLTSAHPAVRSEEQQIPKEVCLLHAAFCACALMSLENHGCIFGNSGDS